MPHVNPAADVGNRSMPRVSPFLLIPPDDQVPEAWLSTIDNRPRAIPQWPESRRMTLVAVVAQHLDTPEETDTEAFVITERAQADRLVDFANPMPGVAALFFRVPRGTVLNPAVCPDGLTEDSWET